jgi:hypothetical protein
MLARIEFEPYEQHKQTTGEFFIRWTTLPRLHLKSSKPLIFAGKPIVPPGYASAVTTPITWDDDADQLLIEFVERYRRRWKLTSQQLNDFAESECKNRWLLLVNPKRARYSRIVTQDI